jgi:GH25 family lysozyme M1 (1,4-beta-N-acetylmuramidase)
MSTGRHRHIDWASRELKVRVAAVSTCAALVAGALAAYGVTRGSVSGPNVRVTEISASPAVSFPPASPAEGHSPRLLRALSGPLSGTGVDRSGSGVAMSTTARQAAATSASTLLNGIDIASFQHPNGAAINWTDVASAGYQFAAIKATEGNYYVNPYYASDAPAAVAAGMYVSAYEFANPADSTGTAAADYTVVNAGNYKVGGQYLPLMLDLEYNPYSDVAGGDECYGLTQSAMVSWVSSFMTEATALTGAAPIIYTPADWWDACTGNSTALAGDVLWVPSYSANAPSTFPAGWNSWTIWQYTSVGTVPGITGDVDLDYFSGGPQTEQTAVNAASFVQIETLNALAGQAVSYTATSLPPGVTMSSAGLITGAPTAAGAYQVTVTAQGTGTVGPASVAFTWDVSAVPVVALGVEGGGGQLWVQVPLGAGWQPLGGVITAPPAVIVPPDAGVDTPAQPWFLATGTDQRLWIRSPSAGWQPIGTGKCIGGPAAAVTGTGASAMVTVACRGLDDGLWYITTPVSGLPAFTGAWNRVSTGVLSAAPAVAPVGTTMTFIVRGTGAAGAIWIWTAAAGWTEPGWACDGGPAAAQQPATGVTTFACQGTDHALWQATNAGSGWSAVVPLGGVIIGSPGVAATSQETDILVEGTDQAVWEHTPAGWTARIGGGVAGGAGAAALN